MVVSPVGIWVRGLLSLLAIGGGIYLLSRWHDALPRDSAVADRTTPDGEPERAPLTGFGERVSAWRPGWDGPTALLAGGLALLLWSGLGGFVTPKLWLRRGDDEPTAERAGEHHRVDRPDGTRLHVEVSGPADGPPVVLTHGWGADATEWYYLRRHLARTYRVIAWDLPGLGLSTRPANRDFSLDKFAADLDAVLALAGGRPAVLVGHSIGGMTMLTFARLYPDRLNSRVAGMVLVHTTPINPAVSKTPTWLVPALQKPLLEPLCWLTIALSPLARLMSWLGYLNGSAHWSNHGSMFAGTETRGQLEFVTRYGVTASPAVLARGLLGMFRYDARPALPAIRVPVLVVAADKDTTTVPEASRRIASAVPGAELTTLAPARHMGLVERHAEFSAVVARFCETVQRTPERVGAARP